MKDSTRARVAATVAASSCHNRISFVYEQDSGRRWKASVYYGKGRVSGYDHSTSSYFFGHSSGSGNFLFFDSETAMQVQLNMKGNEFDGFDYSSGKHFSGIVHHGSVSLYERDTGHHYRFGV